MSNDISIELTHNADEIRDAFNQILARTQDLSPAMRAIAGHLEDATERAFATESSPAGGLWDDLADVTKDRRAAVGKWPGQKLQVTGHLAASIESRFTDNSVSIGTNVIYAAMQQFGGTTSPNSMMPNKIIPARPFLGIGAEDEAAILETLRDFLSTFD